MVDWLSMVDEVDEADEVDEVIHDVRDVHDWRGWQAIRNSLPINLLIIYKFLKREIYTE